MKQGYSKSKLYDLRKHFKKRLNARFNIRLNRFGLRDLLEEFKLKGQFVRKESNLKSWWYLKYQDKDLFLLYDNQRDEFITVYTLKMMIASSEFKKIPFDSNVYKT